MNGQHTVFDLQPCAGNASDFGLRQPSRGLAVPKQLPALGLFLLGQRVRRRGIDGGLRSGISRMRMLRKQT